ncbi:MAG: MarR family transcriptional regulator [Spirochaetia bacterium]|nr:MarR family transcriptional regulator [Spirochaetia bacterium]
MNRIPVEESIDCVCLNLRKTTRKVTQFYEDALRPLNLKATQYSLLAAIHLMDSASMNEVSEILQLDRTSLSRSLNPLLRDKLVITAKGNDKRLKLLHLTDKGRITLYAAFPLWKKAQKQVVYFLKKQKWAKMRSDLNRLSGFLQKYV